MSSKFTTVSLFIIFINFFSISGYGQNFEWVKYQTHSIQTNPDLAIFPSANDAQGNSYLASIYLFKQNYGLGYYGDVSIKKYNSSGTLMLNKIIIGKLLVDFIKTDSQGNIYICGTFMDTIKIDSVNYILNTGSGFNINTFLIKLSSSGSFVWKKNINVLYSSLDIIDAMNIKYDKLYIGLMSAFNGYIKKFDLNGNELMSISELNIRSITGIDVDAQGNIYAGGPCGNGNNIKFGDLTFSTSFIYNVYFVKYNSSGNCFWAKFVENATFPKVYIACDNSGNLYAAGDLFGSFMFGNIQTQGPQWVYDFFLTKLDASGNFLWVKEVPQTPSITGDAKKSEANCLTVDSQNNIYFSGMLRGTMNWGNNVITSATGFSPDALILKYNSNGIIQWGKTAGGSSSDRVDEISIDNLDNIYLSGNFSSIAHFDTLTASGTGNINSYLTKLLSDHKFGIINLSVIMEGFYDQANDNMRMTDTVKVYLRKSSSPYASVDSSTNIINANNFTGAFKFFYASTGSYYTQIKHRNSIETWNAVPLNYTQGGAINYNFTSSASQSFGNNIKQVNTSPVRFGIYGGDESHDGNVDVTDIIDVYNDAVSLTSGYVSTDITGDDFVDVSDLLITYNNSVNVVSVVRP